jgi:hypothetical protein
MSDKFHINPSTGNPNKCSAKSGNCPFGGDSEHFESKDEARLNFEHQNSDQSVKSSRKSFKRVSKASLTPVEPTAANGYMERFDKDGVLTQRVRLVNNHPTDHPSGTPAVFKYSQNRVEEIHYKNGKLHDGSGAVPSNVLRFVDGPNKGTVITHRGYRDSRSSQFSLQDPIDGQPARVIEKNDGSRVIEHYTAGWRQDPATGGPGMIENRTDGTTVEHHFTGGRQHDPADGSPAVTVKRSDGTLEKTVRYHNDYVWDAPNGDPAIVNYDTEGNVTEVQYATLYAGDSGHYRTIFSDKPLKETMSRTAISWMKVAPRARYEEK